MDRIGSYQITQDMMRTHFSRLYLGIDPALRRNVVIKVFAVLPDDCPAPFTVEQWRDRFLAEGRVMARLDHANLLPVLDMGHDGQGQPYLVLPFMRANLPGLIGFDRQPEPGEEMDPRELPRRLDCGRSLAVLRQVLAGLAHMHGRGMVHRDVKPRNILLSNREEMWLRLCDFGMAKAGQGRDAKEGDWFGTEEYISPEQRADCGGVDGKSDVYSAAAVGYRMLAGALYGEGAADLPADVPAFLADAVMAGLQPDPARRPDAPSMLNLLARI